MELTNGGWRAKIIADSISDDGARLTTMEVTFPRIVLAEFNTHRMFSRNSASSRARPVEKVIKDVQDNPFIPTYWGKNQKGMQAEEELSGRDRQYAASVWWEARHSAIDAAKELLKVGAHKQLANRLLEPFMWHTAVVTATEWENFFALRCHKDTQPEIRNVAELMREVMQQHEPTLLHNYAWHLPYVDAEDWQLIREARTRASIEDQEKYSADWGYYDAIRLSVARCARVSYLTQDGKRDHEADYTLYYRLLNSRHMSPFEHVATPTYLATSWSGNFRGWRQHRKDIKNENNALRHQLSSGNV